MDVEQKLEAQGLPKQFGTSSEQPEAGVIATNAEASISNAEVPSAPNVEVQSTPDEASGEASGIAPATTNGFHVEPSIDDVANSSSDQVPAVPDSIPQTTENPSVPSAPLADLDVSTSIADSFADSTVPSSIPAETLQTNLPIDSSEPSLAPISDPVPQPPTSDLRSPPHADELSAIEVAAVEAQKHAEDNAAISEPPPPVELEVAQASAPVEPAASIPEASAFSEATKMTSETGLATPPTQTPPPPPEPAHATLPAEESNQIQSEPVPAALPADIPVEPAPTPAEPAEPASVADEVAQDTEMVSQEPVPAPLESSLITEPVQDTVMVDAPATKVAREREDDFEEPAPKRLKTDEPESSFKVPDVPAAASPSPAVSTPAPDGDDTVTQPRLQHMKKVISNLKKSNASTSFRQPVDHVALKIPTYPDIVKNPMDLSKIDQKLKTDSYAKVSDFVTDFELIVNNSVIFNGKEHAVTQSAFKMQSSFKNQMSHLPKAQFSEPSREEKKAAKAKVEPTRTAPPRRPSVTTASAPIPVAASPRTASVSTPAFAPGPDGIPLIRRDSNMTDGRPKRQIVPTKRNSDFASGRPKKKKYELQLRFCQEVIKDLTSPKNWVMNQYFTHPVDPVALNIPTYFQIIKKPMDLGTVETKLNNNAYEKAKDFEDDVRLVFKNCYKFNPEGDYVNQQGHALEELFNRKWSTKDDWIAAREPPSEPSEAEDEDEDSESEDDADDSEAERNDKIAQLQKQIAEMSKQMGELTGAKPKKKKSKSPSAPASKKSKSKSKKDKPKTTFPGLQKQEKKKPAKPVKEKFVTFAEKQYISNGIGVLPEKQMNEALRIIQNSMPNLKSNDTEIELDIEEVPNHALVKLLNFIKKYAGPPPEETQTDDYAAPPAPSSKPKKNKPMSKAAQEAQIESLRGKLKTYDNSENGPASPGAMQSIEDDDDSDGDDSDESEEE